MAFFYHSTGGEDAVNQPAPVKQGKLVGACLTLIAVFALAWVWEGSASHAKASDALYTAFQVLFTGTVALFGIESAKKG